MNVPKGPRRGRVENLTPFRPGVSGNPGGRPKKTPVTAAYEKFLDMTFRQIQALDKEEMTLAERMALGQIMAGERGKTFSAVEVTDRVEGRVSQRVEVKPGGAESEIERLIAEMAERKAAKKALEEGRFLPGGAAEQ